MQVVVNDTLISYSDNGHGPVLLCVHGWMDSQAAYKQLTAELSNEYRVIAVDLPNFGGSQMTEKIVTTEDYAQFLAALVTKLSLKSYTLVGHSMGCQIAIYGLGTGILHPEKLVLLSPAGVRAHRTGAKKALRFASVIAGPIIPASLKHKFYKRIGSDYDPNFSKIHKAVIKNSLETDIQAQADAITVPTIIVNGSADRSTPMWMAEALNKKIKGSTLEIMQGGDHWVHQNHAGDIAERIRIFTR